MEAKRSSSRGANVTAVSAVLRQMAEDGTKKGATAFQTFLKNADTMKAKAKVVAREKFEQLEAAAKEAPWASTPTKTLGEQIGEQKVENICALGFSPVAARHALKRSHGNPDRACDWLFQDENAKEIEAIEKEQLPEWALQTDSADSAGGAEGCKVMVVRRTDPEEYLKSALEDDADEDVAEEKRDDGRGLGTKRRSWLSAAPVASSSSSGASGRSSSSSGDAVPSGIDDSEEEEQVLFAAPASSEQVAAPAPAPAPAPALAAPPPPAPSAGQVVVEFALYNTWFRASVVATRHASSDPDGRGLTHLISYHTGGEGNEWVALDRHGLRDSYGHKNVPFRWVSQARRLSSASAASNDHTAYAANASAPQPVSESLTAENQEVVPHKLQFSPKPRRRSSLNSQVSSQCEALCDMDSDEFEDMCEEEAESEGEIRLPAPPESESWDWPLSREEKKSRVRLLERQVNQLDRRTLIQELVELRVLYRRENKRVRRLTKDSAMVSTCDDPEEEEPAESSGQSEHADEAEETAKETDDFQLEAARAEAAEPEAEQEATARTQQFEAHEAREVDAEEVEEEREPDATAVAVEVDIVAKEIIAEVLEVVVRGEDDLRQTASQMLSSAASDGRLVKALASISWAPKATLTAELVERTCEMAPASALEAH